MVNWPAPDAPTARVELLTTASSRTFAATELDRPAVAIEAPTATAPPVTPPVKTTWVDESSAMTATPSPPVPVIWPPSCAVTVLATLPTATAASAPK
ncbi:hypothetical protein ACVWWK_006740 [Bradyrhizobium sp. LB9.1b]